MEAALIENYKCNIYMLPVTEGNLIGYIYNKCAYCIEPTVL